MQNDITVLKTGVDLVIERILDLHPVSAPLLAAGRFVNFNTPTSVYTARHRGKFPLKISRFGGNDLVMTSDLIDFLRTGKSQADKNKKAVKIKREGTFGAPTKVERCEAARLGLSIKELRAQAQIGGL